MIEKNYLNRNNDYLHTNLKTAHKNEESIFNINIKIRNMNKQPLIRVSTVKTDKIPKIF